MRRGFTLIEILVAIVLMTVVAALVLLFFRGVNGVAEKGQGVTVDSQGALVLEYVSRTLQQATQGLDPECRFILQASGRGDEAFTFCSLQAINDVPDLRWARTIWNQILWEEEANGGELIQIHRPITGPGSMALTTNVLLTGVTSWEVQAYDGEQWQTAWNSEDAKALPEELQLKMSLDGVEEALEVRVFIPVGKKIESTLERQLAPAGP